MDTSSSALETFIDWLDLCLAQGQIGGPNEGKGGGVGGGIGGSNEGIEGDDEGDEDGGYWRS